VFCNHCGEKVTENTNFCPVCGMRTVIGEEAKVPIPRQRNWEEELESAAERISEEMKKAYTIAGRELEQAANRIKEEMQKAREKELVNCTKCGEQNQKGMNFCFKCGTKL
jgi:uncharacterized membrane protein YvbJ